MSKKLLNEMTSIIKSSKRFSASAATYPCAAKRVYTDIDRKGSEELKDFLGLHVYSEAQPLIVGIAIHEFFELYESHCYEKQVEQDIKFGMKTKGKIIAKCEIPTEMQKDYEIMVDRIIFRKRFNLDYNCMSEIDLAFKIEGGTLKPCDFKDPDALIRGKIDKLYVPKIAGDKYIFTDYKSNRVAFGEDDTESVKQLKFYAVLYALKNPHLKLDNVMLHYDFIRIGEHTIIPFSIEKEKDAIIAEIIEYIFQFQKKVSRAMKNIEGLVWKKNKVLNFINKYFKPSLNRYCACEFMHVCPYYTKGLKNAGIPVDELDTLELKNQDDITQHRRKLGLKVLKDRYKEEQKPIEAGAHFYGQFIKEGEKYNSLLLIEEMLTSAIQRLGIGDEIDEEDLISELLREFEDLEIGKTSIDKKYKKDEIFAQMADKAREVKREKKWDYVPKQKADDTEWI